MSTTHAVLDILTTTYDQINNNNYIGLILLDFKKAFDTVCHKTLLSKLEHYGIRGVTYKLIYSFLSDRQQYVAYQTLCAEIIINSFGVPHGSNLGPLLFLIHINDILHALCSTPRLFADDTCLVVYASKPSTLCEKMNYELLNMLEWTKANKITVYLQKSSVLIIPPKITNWIPDIEVFFN